MFLILVSEIYFLDWLYNKGCCEKGIKFFNKEPTILKLFFIPTLLIIVIVVSTHISYTVSDGQRSGKLIKFSHKGLIFKTYEGTLLVGMDRQWRFSVTDKELADELVDLQGKTLTLEYTQQLYVPPSMGSTSYIAERIVTSSFLIEKP